MGYDPDDGYEHDAEDVHGDGEGQSSIVVEEYSSVGEVPHHGEDKIDDNDDFS